MGSLEKAASKARRAAKREPDPERGDDRTIRRFRRVMLESALADTSSLERAYGYLEAGVCLLGPAVLFGVATGADGSIGDVLPVIGLIIGGVALYVAVRTIRERLTTRWRVARLHRIGWQLDAAAYIEALSDKRSEGVVVATARFAEPWPTDQRALCQDAMRGMVDGLASVALSDDGIELVVRSEPIDGTEYLAGGRHSTGGSVYSNRSIHRRFNEILAALRELDERVPVASLAVDVEGDVVDILRANP